MSFSTNMTHTAFVERQRLAALRDELDAILTADMPPDVTPFLHHGRFADTVRFLFAAWQLKGTVGTPALSLREAGQFAAYRIAVYCRVIRAAKPSRLFTIDDLRAFTTQRGKIKRARRALALLGEAAWNSASRTERAAYLYGELIRRGRA